MDILNPPWKLPWSQRLSFIRYWQILPREPLLLFFFFVGTKRWEPRKESLWSRPLGTSLSCHQLLTVVSDWRIFLIALRVIWLDGLNILGMAVECQCLPLWVGVENFCFINGFSHQGREDILSFIVLENCFPDIEQLSNPQNKACLEFWIERTSSPSYRLAMENQSYSSAFQIFAEIGRIIFKRVSLSKKCHCGSRLPVQFSS